MSNRVINWFKFASPLSFYPLAGRMIPWFWALFAVFGLSGLWIGFFAARTDAVQGEGYRIIFVHVAASWMSMFIYLVMAAWAGLGLVFNARLSAMMAQALAPTGALMAFLSLWTGAFWGKPMWGAWWVWDARLTSELILLFLYLGFIALQASIAGGRGRVDGAALAARAQCPSAKDSLGPGTGGSVSDASSGAFCRNLDVGTGKNGIGFAPHTSALEPVWSRFDRHRA